MKAWLLDSEYPAPPSATQSCLRNQVSRGTTVGQQVLTMRDSTTTAGDSFTPEALVSIVKDDALIAGLAEGALRLEGGSGCLTVVSLALDTSPFSCALQALGIVHSMSWS